MASGAGPAPQLDAPLDPALSIALDGVRVEGDRVTFGPGTVHLAGTLEIPSSHDVVFAPGLDLRMGPGAALGIYGDLESRGFSAGTEGPEALRAAAASSLQLDRLTADRVLDVDLALPHRQQPSEAT